MWQLFLKVIALAPELLIGAFSISFKLCTRILMRYTYCAILCLFVFLSSYIVGSLDFCVVDFSNVSFPCMLGSLKHLLLGFPF